MSESTRVRFEIAEFVNEHWTTALELVEGSRDESYDQVMAAAQWLDDLLSAELMIAGFLRTLDLMYLWQTLFRNLLKDERIELGQRATLRRRIGQMTGWRVSLHEESTKERFMSVAINADAVIIDLARLLPATVKIEERSFASQVEALVNQWLRDHPFYLTSGNTA